MNTTFKQLLHKHCLQQIEGKIKSLRSVIDDAQIAANQESKSTAGDKHDTSRAMMQIEVEQKSKQLAEAKKMYNHLNNLDPKKKFSEVQSGSIVTSLQGQYYISVGLGTVKFEGKTIFCISPASPLAQKMLGLKKGSSFEFNDRLITIENIQ